MRKLLLLIGIFMITALGAFAAKFPEDVKGYIQQNVPKAEIRFDGVIIFPSNTLYLPLYPSLFSDTKTLAIKRTLQKITSITFFVVVLVLILELSFESSFSSSSSYITVPS